MNQTALLHIVERLESFVGKLPETIRRPVLSELIPLKELFLQQRPPRFRLRGAQQDAEASLYLPAVRQGAGAQELRRHSPGLAPRAPAGARSEERRVGKESTEQCRSRWSPYH